MSPMTRTWAELLLLAALLAAAWIAFGHGLMPPATSGAPARAPARAQGDPVGNGLGERARQLRAFIESPLPRGAARRNPFAFAPSRRATDAAGLDAAARPDPPQPEPRPELVLSGIAEDADGGATVRTAVIVAAGQLVLAREGDRVLSRFVVLRIAADAVQIQDTARGDVFTLAFK
jgi:hypothetical protein